MVFSVFLYFALGFILDAIITLQYKAVIAERPLFAAFLSILITSISLLVIQHIIIDYSIVLVLAYAIGTGIGTIVGMYIKRTNRSGNS